MLDISPEDSYRTNHQPVLILDKRDEAYLVNNYSLLIKKIVHQLKYQSTPAYDFEDMEQTALLALFNAASKFDDIYSDAFPSYAKTKIRGAILDELRRLDWRTRSARQAAHKLDKCIKDLTAKLNREPKDNEICTAMGITSDELFELYQDLLNHESSDLDDVINNPAMQVPEGNQLMIISEEMSFAIKHLNHKEQTLLSLIYQHELNQSEVAVVLELTTARVCQLHKQALSKLRHEVDKLRGGYD